MYLTVINGTARIAIRTLIISYGVIRRQNLKRVLKIITDRTGQCCAHTDTVHTQCTHSVHTHRHTYCVTVMTGLLFTSERSHYFHKSYLEERGLTSTKSYADRLTKIRQKFLKVLTLVWVAGTNVVKDNDRVILHESYQSYNKSLDVIKCK